MVPAKSDFCAECGAPLGEGLSKDGSDAAIYPELARANLLRMRGDFKAAEDVCLSILRRFPNNATANTLLGDIASEKGDLEQAAEWYELALDIVPDSAADKDKLDRVKQRLTEREAAATAQQLGVPTRRSIVPLYVAIFVVVLIVAAAGAYVMNKQDRKTMGKSDPNVNAPIKIKDNVPKPTGDPGTKPPTTTTSGGTEQDRQFATAISKETSSGSKITQIQILPNDKSATISFALAGEENNRLIAADLARAAFTVAKKSEHDYLSQIQTLDIRGIRDGNLVYSATIKREHYEMTLSADWIDTHKDEPNAWIDAILTSEWPAKATETPPATTGDGTATDTTGDAATPPDGTATSGTETTGA